MVVVAGDVSAAGDMPGAGEIAAAGLAKVGGAAGDVPSGGGGGWPKEVNRRVTEQRLAISSVFIGFIGKFFPGSNLDKRISRFVYPQSGKLESSKTFAFVFSAFRILAEPLSLFRIIRPFGL
jgi:hypothetical protein